MIFNTTWILILIVPALLPNSVLSGQEGVEVKDRHKLGKRIRSNSATSVSKQEGKRSSVSQKDRNN